MDTRGVVTSRFAERNYGERHSAASIITRLGGDAGTQVTTTDTPHLRIVSRVSDAVAVLGAHLSVRLDITPKPRMHIYAPPQTTYRPVALTIEPDPRLVAESIEFPAGEEYVFKPLNERVQVYQRPFRLVQGIQLSLSPESRARTKGDRNLRIRGTLSYQACDDRLCYTPQSVPLSWDVQILPFTAPDKKE